MTKTTSLVLVSLLSLVCTVGAQAQSVDCDNPSSVIPDGRLNGSTIPAGAVFWFALSTSQPVASYTVEANFPQGAAAAPTLGVFVPAPSPTCTAGAVTTRDITALTPAAPNGQRLSFLKTSAGAATFLLRVSNPSGASQGLTLRVAETTQVSPRWSTFGGFFTSWGFHNTSNAALTGTLHIINGAGTTVATANIPLPAGRVAFTDTLQLGVGANDAGSCLFIHDGPPGTVLADGFIQNFLVSPPVIQPVKFEPLRASSQAASSVETAGGGGGVNSVTAGDASITIGGTPADPTVRVSNGGITPAKLSFTPGTVTSLTEGTGIDLSPNTITTTGSIGINISVVPQLGAANIFTENNTFTTASFTGSIAGPIVAVTQGSQAATALMAVANAEGGGVGVQAQGGIGVNASSSASQGGTGVIAFGSDVGGVGVDAFGETGVFGTGIVGVIGVARDGGTAGVFDTGDTGSQILSGQSSGLEVFSVGGNGSVNTAGQFISSLLTGTPPLQVGSTTKVDNLNADLLDGLDSADLALAGHIHDDRYFTESELSTAGSINDGGNPVDWTKLKDVPAGFADGIDDNSGGTVTSVVTGTGLTGGPITTSGTLSVAGPLMVRTITYLAGCDSCSVLADEDDQHAFYVNLVGSMTINSVTCFSDAGTPLINLQRDDGSPASILGSDLMCSSPGTTTMAISGPEATLNLNDKLDFVMVAAGGTARRVTVVIKATLN